MTKIIICNKPTNLEKELSKYHKTASVEAEFGDTLVEGNIITMAHHGPRKDNLCPCLYSNNCCKEKPDVIGISHVDLDTLGGIMAILSIKPDSTDIQKEFWKLAAFVDINGPHKIKEFNPSNEVLEMIYAFWAYSQENRIFAPRDGSVKDITDKIEEYFNVINTILCNTNESEKKKMIENGRIWKKNLDNLNTQSYLKLYDTKYKIIIRKSDQFVNHLYETPNGEICDICIAYNTDRNSVTISFAEKINNIPNCRELVQEFWGNEAGGHDVIAGSPREKLINEKQFWEFIQFVKDKIS